MATLVLSAAGAAVGGALGGSVAGLSTAVVGRAVGATVGQVIDQSIMGGGSDVIEAGRIDRFRLSASGEGEPVSQMYGRLRVGGQTIWASDFAEDVSVTSSGGGKGAPSQPKTTTRSYNYSVSLAVAVCEGTITRIGRIWADGEEIAPDDLNMRVYKGDQTQLPDPLIEAIEGSGTVPAYRGTAYVVFENLSLERFGNRVPQFSFEVSRPEQEDEPDAALAPTYAVKSVALIPGTGEYALATTPVYYARGAGESASANINSPNQKTDFLVSMDALSEDLPNCEAVSLIVSWFGDDLRCNICSIKPKVEKKNEEGANMPWNVAGLNRATADEIVRRDGRPIYGGTPTDQSVIEAIRSIQASGKKVMFYPFILMDQLAGNGRPNPYDPTSEQPELPWRGRITLSRAPGVSGSPDNTSAAQDEVDAFFGSVNASHFQIAGDTVTYSGPQEWSLSRFILHYAALCQAAGGVDAFCISSEMRGFTQIRAENSRFPAVEKLVELTAQVRLLLGPSAKISYAADWSEYFGYQPQDGSNDRYFHLDPLWADSNIDFIGIDNYMPLSDWREGSDHLDVGAGSIYDLDYLRANVMGGEGYDWFYADDEARLSQMRTSISDGAYNEPWVYRYKDLRNWWSNPHHDRIAGVRQPTATPWVPASKPFWFTEMGCAAIDKGTNQPNKFIDPKSSESRLPFFSSGARDDLMQTQYLKAMVSFWTDAANNPVSPTYGAPMVNMDRAFVWAWDARPYPYFPNNSDVWSDAENYGRGHWINGRTSARSLASVVAEICLKSGLTAFDTSQLYGTVRGFVVNSVSEARAALQPLMLRYGFDSVERDGSLVFKMRNTRKAVALDRAQLAQSADLDADIEQSRKADAEVSGRVRLRFMQADGSFEALSEESVLSDEKTHAVSASELPLAMTRAEGRQVVERWLNESRVARDTIRFALPPSLLSLGGGDIVSLQGEQQEGTALYRIDSIEQGALQVAEASRIDPQVYTTSDIEDDLPAVRRFVPPVPVFPLFLDLPLITGDEAPHAPHIAVTAQPWPGAVAVYQSASGNNYELSKILPARSIVGVTQNALSRAPSGRFDDGPALSVRLTSGALSAIDDDAVLAGGNLAAIGDGTSGNWEVFQFGRAELVSERTFELTRRLRGQLGSDALMPDVWPAGSYFVLLDGIPEQMDLQRSLRGVSQTYRIGPAQRPLVDPSYLETSEAFAGNGLRPYAPVHLSVTKNDMGGLEFGWVRRTRVDGDAWDAADVPLGEENEAYRVRIVKDDMIVREETLTKPNWIYPLSEQASDGLTGSFDIEVAQLSATFGAGPVSRLRTSI